MRNLRYLFLLLFFIFLPLGGVFASTSDGTVSGYAWSSQIGWINFGTTNGNIHITDSAVTGYAWNENMGRINLNPTTSGVQNSCTGALSGSAWSEGTGWIYFSGVNVGSSGVFSGTASGDNNVAINFTCDHCNVTTDWRPCADRTIPPPPSSGGGGSVAFIPPPPIQPDTVAPTITINPLKGNYVSSQEVLIGGTSESGAQVFFFIDDRYALLPVDQSGNWIINVGKLSPGKHHVEAYAKDAAGNKSNTAAADFSVYGAPVPYEPPIPNILKKITDGVQALLPKFFQPKGGLPNVAVTVPKETPLAFKADLFSFHYIATSVLARLVLRPLPGDVKLLAQKFPQIEKTFNQVGIKKITDLQKLSNANLTLPSLTETVLPKPILGVGKFAVPRGVPIESLSQLAKANIPSEVVFAKAAGGLVDVNVALSINDQGKTQQKIQTITNQTLQLVVKPDASVKKVVGYVVFKSKKYTTTAMNLPMNSLTASLLFANPDLALLMPESDAPGGQPADIEKRLVLSTFEYSDTGNGVYASTIHAPSVDGEYEIITVIDYADASIKQKEINLITLVDPEGYIYEKNGDLETRIAGAISSLYWLNPDTKQYELWPAPDYQQENPQTTDARGTYSFLVPDGYYYLKVDAPGYLSYDGKPFEVKEGSGIHINVQLKTQYWFLKIVDWKTFLLVIVVLLLLYNFYRDKMRDRGRNSKISNQVVNNAVQ